MCFKYRIVYFGCMSKERLPWCTPERNQIREYINADGWQLCENVEDEQPCKDAGLHTCTFVEPYCSDACEKFFEGMDVIEGNKDRLSYADDEIMIEGCFPTHASFGHLRVDYDRVMLLYYSLIELANDVASNVEPQIEFPITESFPARYAASFLTKDKSKLLNDLMDSFPTLQLEEKVQVLQRIMGIVSFATTRLRSLSCQASFMFESTGRRDNDEWRNYAQNVDDQDASISNFPTALPKPLSEGQERIRWMVTTWCKDSRTFELSQEPGPSKPETELSLIRKELDDLLDTNTDQTQEAIEMKALHIKGTRKQPPLFKGVNVDPYNPFSQYDSEDEAMERSLPTPKMEPGKRALESSAEGSKSRSVSPFTDSKGKMPIRQLPARQARPGFETQSASAPKKSRSSNAAEESSQLQSAASTTRPRKKQRSPVKTRK